MTRQAGLGLDDPTRPVPTRPTLIHAIGGAAHVEVFDDLKALAARAVQLAGAAAGLRLAEQAWACAASGFGDTFPAWSIYVQAPDGSEDWLGSAAVQQISRDRLEAALADAHQAAASRGRAAAGAGRAAA